LIGGGSYDSPQRNPCSRRAGRFLFLDAAGVPLDAGGEDLSTCYWPCIPLDAGKDLSTCCWACIPLDAGTDLTTHLRRFWMLLVSHWMPARISACRWPRIPLDAGEDLTTHLLRFGMLLVSHCWMPKRIPVSLAVGPVSHWMPTMISPLAVGPVFRWMQTRT
jgi:hypothetical protein